MATKKLQIGTLGWIAGIDLAAGVIWIAIALRTWLWDVPELAFFLLALGTLMIVSGSLLYIRSSGTYLLAMIANLLMAGRMVAVSIERVGQHLRGEQIPGYWVPISGTLFSLLQVLLFLTLAALLLRMILQRHAEHRQDRQNDLGAAGGWDRAG